MTDYREFITIIGFDEDAASRYDETNGRGDNAPGDFLEREFDRLDSIGISLDDWAIVDGGVRWERYLRYLVQWAIEHNSEGYEGMSPACYDEWRCCEDGEV